MSYPSSRHRDRGSRYHDDLYASDPFGDPRAFAAPESSPPRRHKSQRGHRGGPPPEIYQQESPEPRRHGGRRESSLPSHDDRRRHHSSVPVAPSPPRHGSRPSRSDRDAYAREPMDRDRDRRPRDYHPDYAPAGRDRHRRSGSLDDDYGMRRARTAPQSDPKHRPRGRDYPPPSYESHSPPPRRSRPSSRGRAGGYEDRHHSPPPRRRPASQARGYYDRDPSPHRGRPPPAAATRSNPKPRRNSMPAPSKSKKGSGTAWWQNPLVQAGARTAFTAGAQAAVKNRNDPSPWLGPKGAKVATAAIGAALVDSFIGKKHPGGKREDMAKEGIDFASAKLGEGLASHGVGYGSGRRHR